jgi:hypothetical protein
MLIEVQETHPAGPGKKMATVIAAGGQRFEVYPEKLADFQVGQRYDAEIEDREYQGRTFRKIVKAAPVNGVAHPTGNGAAKPNGPANGSSPAAAAGLDGEAEFVGRALHALILKGDVTLHMQRVLDATLMLREVWRISGRQANGGGGHA